MLSVAAPSRIELNSWNGTTRSSWNVRCAGHACAGLEQRFRCAGATAERIGQREEEMFPAMKLLPQTPYMRQETQNNGEAVQALA